VQDSVAIDQERFAQSIPRELVPLDQRHAGFGPILLDQARTSRAGRSPADDDDVLVFLHKVRIASGEARTCSR
jgi:hypothetical protein